MTSPIPPADPDEQYLARLRAADPAADSVPDAGALRAAVAARAAVPDQLAERRSRRWLPVAAAAAAALVVGTGGGYAVGALRGDGSAVVAADDGASSEEMAGGAVAPMAGGPESGGAVEGADAARGGASTDLAWGYYGRTVFTADGLSADGGVAHTWALDAAAASTEETVRTLAQALGLDPGTIRNEDGTWLVGPNDGTGATVSLYLGSGADLSYYDPAADAWSCAVVEEPAPAEGEGAEPAPDVAIGGPCAERDLGPAPSAEEATAQLLAVLAAAGIAEADVEIESDGSDGWQYLTAHRLVGGERSGLSWSASFTGGGLQSLYGTVAPIVDLGEYPVISPVAAVARLGDPRFGSSGPIAFADEVQTLPAPEQGGQVQVPTTPEPGAAISWPVAEVSIVGAELGLSTYTQADGAVVIAPTYQLTGDDGSVWSVIALADDALAF